MSMKNFGFLFAMLLILAQSACSGGGYRGPSGRVCSASGYDPIPMDINKDNKPDGPLKLKLDGSDQGLKSYAGTFSYSGAEIYYHEAKTGIQIHVSDAYSEKRKKIESNTVCVNGFKPYQDYGADPFVNLTSLSTFQVNDTGAIEFKIRNFVVQFQNGVLSKNFGVDTGTDSQVPGKVYEGTGFDYQLYKMNPNVQPAAATDFEVRSHAIIGKNQAEISVVVRFKRSLIKP